MIKIICCCASRRIQSEQELHNDPWTENLGDEKQAEKLIGKELFGTLKVLLEAKERKEAADREAG